MMTAEAAALYSATTAQDVLDALITFARRSPNEFLALEMVSYESGAEHVHPALFVRLDEPGGKTTLADKSEILHCLTDSGREVSVVIGKPDEREFQPARILVSTD